MQFLVVWQRCGGVYCGFKGVLYDVVAVILAKVWFVIMILDRVILGVRRAAVLTFSGWCLL